MADIPAVIRAGSILTDILEEFTALMMEAVCSFETLVNIYQTTWHNIPEDSQSSS
jgi:hypothetical protein